MSTSFYTHMLLNEVDLVTLACEDGNTKGLINVIKHHLQSDQSVLGAFQIY